MKTIYSQIVLGGVFALAIVSDAYAQDRTAVLTTIEVSRLVTNGRPVDHAHLRDHFAALADTYAAKAVRNEAAARTLTGNPNHPPAVSPGALYIRIAEQDRALAAELRELAAYHGSRAAGRTATFPEAASAFERGEGAPAPTDGQIRELVASAQTPADHQALETYFTN